MSIPIHIRKFLRFVGIYGPMRAWYKAAGRLRLGAFLPTLRPRAADVGIIGCGQFAFATIGYFIQTAGHRFGACFDTDSKVQADFARSLRVPMAPESAAGLLRHPGLRTVYIASNHASHAAYAAQALNCGYDTYVEKPVAVSQAQFVALLKARAGSKARLFAGYNRPFSAALRELRALTPIDPRQGITLQCFVAGHKLEPGHWYRQPDEGTRICGNVGHWLDLMVHVLAWRGLPDRLDISLLWADDEEPDDNVSISIRSNRADLFSVLLTSRNEPFEGINETINFQHGETSCKIDDFRQMVVWQGAEKFQRRYWPKDVGHELAILQPFSSGPGRDWHEVELSTLLMLHITDMVRQRCRSSAFSISEQWSAIELLVAGAEPDARSSQVHPAEVS
jgi:predicted dehydrogenase